MIKLLHLYWLERIVSLAMAFSMGFLVGTNYPTLSPIYCAVLIGVCALLKIELGHWGKKLQKSQQQ